MKLVGLIIILALVLAWSLAMVAMLKGYDGVVAGASIAGIVTLGELTRLIIKAKGGKGDASQNSSLQAMPQGDQGQGLPGAHDETQAAPQTRAPPSP